MKSNSRSLKSEKNDAAAKKNVETVETACKTMLVSAILAGALSFRRSLGPACRWPSQRSQQGLSKLRSSVEASSTWLFENPALVSSAN